MLNAILPIFILILMGFTIRHYRLLSDEFWNDTEKFVYYVLFPAMLVSKMSVADLSSTDAIPLISVLMIGLAIISLITFLIKPLLSINDSSFTSVYQGATRINTFIAVSIAENLFGNSGLVTAVIVAAILIPALNFIVVTVLQRYGDNRGPVNFINVIKQIVKNPLIIGCVIGIGLNLSNIVLPSPLQITVTMMGSMALPLGLMAVGAALIFRDLKSVVKPLLASSTLKLIIYPLISYALTVAFDLDRETQIVVLIFSAVPTASSAYILAKNMGGDHQLMSRIITFQTLFSIVTYFVMFWLLGV